MSKRKQHRLTVLDKRAARAAVVAARRKLDEAEGPPDLLWFDYIVESTSGGKDSEVSQDVTTALARAAGVPEDRMVVVHADLGDMEWADARELAERQTARYGHRFEVVSRTGQISAGQCRNKQGVPLYAKGEAYGDLLDQVRHRHRQLKALGRDEPPWYGPGARYCTGDHKTNPCGALFTQLATEWRKANPELAKTRPCRILDVCGMRAQESHARAIRPQVAVRTSTKNQHVVTWLPIKWWSLGEVWVHIFDNELEYHPAYDLGMPRLSCVLCPFAGRDALMVAAEHNPELLARFVAVEREVGWAFKQGLKLEDIQTALKRGERAKRAKDWAA